MTPDHHFVVLASLAADALALGAHWIYDTQQIDREIGRLTVLRAPLPGSFHAGKVKGDLTHYGDQTVVLLQSLREEGGFSLTAFAQAWRGMATNYTGYRDRATRETLARVETGLPLMEAGSSSSDLGGAARIAPLVSLYQDDEDSLMAAVREQTAMTHRNAQVIESAAYFAQVTTAVLQGIPPVTALQEVARRHFDQSQVAHWVAEGLRSRGIATRDAIAKFGQACEVSAAFPGVVHVIARYQDDPQEGLIENVMAGGDSAARGLLAGMVLGAYSGAAAVAKEWVREMNRADALEDDLQALARMRGK